MTNILKSRIRKLNSVKKENGESVIYIMSRDQRVEANHALITAQKHAESLNLPVIVYFVLYPSVKNRIKNQYIWMINGLKEIEISLKNKNIPFKIKVGKAVDNYKIIESENNPAAFYFDFSPLKGPRKVKKNFASDSETPCFVVDTHNILPVWETSEKEEYAARTIRSKILRKLRDYLVEPDLINNQDFELKQEEINWNKIINSIQAENIETYEPVVKSGEKEAHRVLNNFINAKLEDYDDLRNDPANNHLSNLSAYFHYGQISTLQVALKLKNQFPNAFKLPKDETNSELEESIEAFLEESIIRKELSDNFCYYNENYDNLNGAKDWAIKTLKDHAKDSREYIYSFEELENSKTHDAAWNAAQNQMRKTGKMHGYMRMYWAKKILEWTKSPELALEYSIKLNDKYELDGYDPNGYVGCMWSIAGIHDRGWTERDVFGKIRYMNFNGLKRKFDIDRYIEDWENVL